jgi:DNA-binding NarL/FixJ family response regulator
MATKTLRIVIADDNTLFRQGLISLLRAYPDVAVVAEAGSLAALPALLAEFAPDIILLDLQIDRDALTDLPSLAARAGVVVMSAGEQVEETLAAVRAGARAVVPKQAPLETLTEAIRTVARGHVWLPPALQARLVAGLHDAADNSLTMREREIVRLGALGLRNAEIGQRLCISEQTVKTHLNNVYRKLGIRDRSELVLYSVRSGLIGIHERRP